MKTKLQLIFMLFPMISMAHAGHEHNVTHILLNPLSWANHGLTITFLAILSLVLLRKIVLKYFPDTFKSFAKK